MPLGLRRAYRWSLAGAALAATLAACGGGAGAPSEQVGHTTSALPTTFPNDQAAFDYFVAKGLTNYQAAGIVGNLDQESGADPNAVQQQGPGRGIAQWSAGGRWDTDGNDNAVWYAGATNQNVWSLQLQLDFIWYELTTFAGYGLGALQASSDVVGATIAFETDFEGCGQCNQSQRIAYAQSILSANSCTPHCQDANTIIDSNCNPGNCAAYASSCVDDNLGARCVFFACPAQGTATVCLPDGHTIGNCSNGAISTGDCAAFGAKCVDDNLGARCVFDECPAQGKATICLPDGHTIGTCNNGQLSQGDCAAYGCSCVDDDLGARCVFFACPAKGNKTVCLPDGHTLGDCNDGAVKTQDCAASGDKCETADGSSFCAGPLAATLVAKGSTAKPSLPNRDPTMQSDYTVCAGQPVTATFELHDVGTLPWTDANDDKPGDAGKAVRLGTSDGTKRDFVDPLEGKTRISLDASSNPDVSPTGAACNDKNGCARTVFTVSGTAPSTPGIIVTTWQLVDETRAWFGPVMALRFDVTPCDGTGNGAGSSSGGPSGQPSTDAGASGGCSVTTGPSNGFGVDALGGLFAWLAVARFTSRAKRLSTILSSPSRCRRHGRRRRGWRSAMRSSG